MISIIDYNSICKNWVDEIQELESHHLVAQDNHAVNALKDERGIQLVAVIPSTTASGSDPSSISDNHSALFFVLSKGWTGQTKVEELDQYEKTQAITLEIRSKVLESFEEGCGPFWQLSSENIPIDPEYNIFGGWNGWSMSLSF
jgi:hypothetical protein